jgi:hypothetical protein
LKALEPLRVVAPLLLLIVAGCPGEKAQRGRGEAGRVAHAVHQLREADNPAKRPLLESLSRLQCKETDVRELQQTCVAAYRSHLEGVDKSEAVRRSLDAPDAQVAQRTTELMAELDSAEELLRGASHGTQRCAELEGKLRRKHKL